MENLLGRQFGHFQIITSLGKGGMASVYKAYQPNMDRYVALKVLPRFVAENPDFHERFTMEARVIAKLEHPHILPVFEFGESEGYTYLAMRLVEGGTLTSWVRKNSPLDMETVTGIVMQVGSALDYAHKMGVIHRDLKPGNILVDEMGNCLLTDFGLAKMMESSIHMTHTGKLIGTPSYMSPEQGLGKVLDHRSDLYSLGVILYNLALGELPYIAETPMATVLKHINDPLPSPRQRIPELPEGIEKVILTALAKEPAGRYSSAGEMVRAMQKAIVGHEKLIIDNEEPTIPLEQPHAAEKETDSGLFSGFAQKVAADIKSIVDTAETLTMQGDDEKEQAGLYKTIKQRLAVLAVLLIVLAGVMVYRNFGDPGGRPVGSASVGATLPESTLNDVYVDNDLLLAEIDAAMKQGKVEDALSLLNDLLKKAPDMADAFCEKGKILYAQQNWPAAREAFRQCGSLAKGQGNSALSKEAAAMAALSNAGETFQASGNPDAAVKYLDELLKGASGGFDWLYCEKGQIYLEAGRLQESLENFTACRQGSIDARRDQHAQKIIYEIQGMSALENMDIDGAKDYFKAWADMQSEQGGKDCRIARIFAGKGHYQQALESFEQCSELTSDLATKRDAELNKQVMKARIAFSKGQYQDAVYQFTNAINLAEEREPRLYCDRAESLINLAAFEEAMLDVSRCRKLSQQDRKLNERVHELFGKIRKLRSD